jgi:hypothetical protein
MEISETWRPLIGSVKSLKRKYVLYLMLFNEVLNLKESNMSVCSKSSVIAHASTQSLFQANRATPL